MTTFPRVERTWLSKIRFDLCITEVGGRQRDYGALNQTLIDAFKLDKFSLESKNLKCTALE